MGGMSWGTSGGKTVTVCWRTASDMKDSCFVTPAWWEAMWIQEKNLYRHLLLLYPTEGCRGLEPLPADNGCRQGTWKRVHSNGKKRKKKFKYLDIYHNNQMTLWNYFRPKLVFTNSQNKVNRKSSRYLHWSSSFSMGLLQHLMQLQALPAAFGTICAKKSSPGSVP